MYRIATYRLWLLAAAVVVLGAWASPLQVTRSRGRGVPGTGARYAGTWFGQLDAEPFGLPPGVSLAALLTIHPDGTLIVTDAGDFGAPPINLVQSPQFGSWARTGPRTLRATALFLAGDPASLDATAVKRTRFDLRLDADDDHLVGVVESVDQLACPAGPLPGFLNCPNPILAPASAWVPEPGGAPNVPFEAWRLRAR